MVSSNEIFSKYLGDQIRPRGQVASYPSRVVLTCSIIAEDCTITLRRTCSPGCIGAVWTVQAKLCLE